MVGKTDPFTKVRDLIRSALQADFERSVVTPEYISAGMEMTAGIEMSRGFQTEEQ
jgi:hypothetical protein